MEIYRYIAGGGSIESKILGPRDPQTDVLVDCRLVHGQGMDNIQVYRKLKIVYGLGKYH
jgi:hypothetical protein